jgi:uncharacterized protein (DUF1499 family)
MRSRIDKNLNYLIALISSKQYSFDDELWSSLPEDHGVYRIFEDGADWSSSLRVGRTKSAEGGLRQRVYQNHFMGNQQGNIKAQLVEAGKFQNQEEAKEYLKAKCKVQFITIEDKNERKWTEHFIISILQPQFSD